MKQLWAVTDESLLYYGLNQVCGQYQEMLCFWCFHSLTETLKFFFEIEQLLKKYSCILSTVFSILLLIFENQFTENS